jgi:hypothetical protein
MNGEFEAEFTKLENDHSDIDTNSTECKSENKYGRLHNMLLAEDKQSKSNGTAKKMDWNLLKDITCSTDPYSLDGILEVSRKITYNFKSFNHDLCFDFFLTRLFRQ